MPGSLDAFKVGESLKDIEHAAAVVILYTPSLQASSGVHLPCWTRA